MKKILRYSIVCIFFIGYAPLCGQQDCGFSIGAPQGTEITCAQASVTLQAFNDQPGPYVDVRLSVDDAYRYLSGQNDYS
jgi:hypothetical protein